MAELMNFTNGQCNNLHEQSEVGGQKTNLTEQKTMGMSKVARDQKIGNFETVGQAVGPIGSRIEKGIDSRNLMSMA